VIAHHTFVWEASIWSAQKSFERFMVWRCWFDRYGRSRIEPCRSRDDVADYCSKYVTKKDVWWNFKLDHQSWLALQKGKP